MLLTANQVPPFNAFVALPWLEERVGSFHQANLLLVHLPGDAYWAMPGNGWRDQFYAWMRRLTRQPMPPVLMITNALSTKIALARLDRALDQRLDSTDVQLRVIASGTTPPDIEIRSSRVFLDSVLADAVFQAATNSAGVTHFPEPLPYGVLTYLANLIQHGDHATPYSMVTAAAPPLVPADLQDNEILISQWLADDLGAGPGATIELVYFQPDQASQMTEVTNRFRIKAVLRMNDPAFDRSLMPDFPGVADAEKPGEWQTGFPLQHKIREKDDEYWREYRGTPKAFITLKAGQQLWGNRFGNLTAIRFPLAAGQEQFWYLHQTQIEQGLRGLLQGTVTRNQAPGGPLFDRRALGFRWEPVREQALAASAPTQDFGQLFLGFSFFLILAALILMALLFQFGLEQRAQEIGTLLALGFRPRRVRWLLLGEGTLVAFVGGVLGVFGGVAYAQGMIRGLTTIWRNAIGTSALQFHVTPVSVVIGLFSSVAVCALTIWIVLRKQARQPARVLLAPGDLEETEIIATGASAPRGRFMRWVAIGANSLAIVMVAGALWRGEGASPQLFFGAGSLLLVGLIATVSLLLTALERSTQTRHLTLAGLGLRGCTRRRTRSLACVTLLACGSFIIVAVGANRLDADRQPTARSSGTGGFALLGESALPVVRDLNTPAGREFYGLNEADFAGVRLVPFRVRAGDDASCLNLNRAHAPRVLGVKPELLAERRAFSFAQVERGRDGAQGWNLLKRTVAVGKTALGPDEIPAIGDAASIQWALGKKLGDTIDYIDEQGRAFKLRLVAGVANSILQGSLIIDEAEFVKRFPSESGHRMFLIDVSTNQPAAAAKIEAALGRALRDVGLELTPTTRRLAAFNAVQNTYLNTFQVLGGLGLLLGSAGLGVVVLRNVLERRAEFGLLQAVGWRRRSLQWLVLSEHGGLLWLGLGAGLIAALAAILPVLLAPGAEMHTRAFAATLVGVFASGLIWTWLATLFALRGRLLDALQDE